MRIAELDCLRGVAVLWLVAYYLLRPSGALPARLHGLLEHGDGLDLRLADLGPPGFLMLSAASLGLSLHGRRVAGESAALSVVRILRRSLALCALGVALDAASAESPVGGHWRRLLSVIALSDLCNGLAFLAGGARAASALWIGFLVAPTALFACGQATQDSSGPHAADGFLAEHAWIFSAMAAGASTGWLVELLGRRAAHDPARILRPLGTGVVCVNLAMLLSFLVPIRSHDWSPTYSLLCSGSAFVIFAGAAVLCSHPFSRGWCDAIACIGRNPLAALLATVGVQWLVAKACASPSTNLPESFRSAIWILGFLGVALGVHRLGKLPVRVRV
jgi:predicted acyltransferase